MATMARITTTRSAAAMTTAAVGLRPKMVVRSVAAARGKAEPSSLLALGSAGAAGLEGVEPPAASEGPDTDPPAEPDGVVAEPGGLWVCASATATRPTAASATRRTAMCFMVHLLGVS